MLEFNEWMLSINNIYYANDNKMSKAFKQINPIKERSNEVKLLNILR
jgi:hypothetical protein